MGFVDLNNGGSGPGTGGYGPVPTPLYRHLDLNGDGTGTKNLIQDYSVSSDIASIQPPAGQVYRITRMLTLIGGKASSVKTDSYGSVPALSNGIQVRVQNDSGTIIDLVDGVNITSNANWGRVCFDSIIYSSTSNTDTYNRVRWTFEKSGYPLRLDGDKNERLEVVLNDDFTDGGSANALTKHYFVVQGYIENTT